MTNKNLRPEKTGQLNFGIDFGSKSNRLSGTIEVYDKRNIDLISSNNIDPTTGLSAANYNVADMHGRGLSFNLQTVNVKLPDFSWVSSFFLSSNKVSITKIYTDPEASGFGGLLSVGGIKGLGNDINGIYAVRWGGLSPTDGSPLLISGGKPTNDYLTVFFEPLDSLRYMGSTTPKFFGSLRNSITYKGFSVSFNILYKLGYYFRRPQNTSLVNYASMVAGSQLPPAEYEKRWQKPGDELHTNVPAFVYPVDAFYMFAYAYADINVLRADNVRLQEINISYAFPKKIGLFKGASLHGSIQNLGIIWRANKYGLDPDVLDIPLPHTYSIGFSTNF